MNGRRRFVLVFIFLLHLTAWGQQQKPAVPPGRKTGVRVNPVERNKEARKASLDEADLEPLELIASVASTTSVHLFWNDEIEHENSFVIQRSITPGDPDFVTLQEVGANMTAYVDEGLQPGIYYYRVYATVEGESPIYSNMASASLSVTPLLMSDGEVTTCDRPFLDPGGFGGYADEEDKTLVIRPSKAGKKVGVSFSAFELLDSDYPDVGDKLEVFDGTDVHAPSLGSYSGIALPPHLNATNAAGALTFHFTSGYSDEGFGWQAQLSCFTIPTGLEANVTGRRVDLQWRDNTSDEAGYLVERRAVGEPLFLPLEPLGPNITTYSDLDVPPDNRYEYRVRAYRSDQPSYSVLSNTVSAAVGEDPLIMHEGEFSVCDRSFLDPGGNGPYPIASPDEVYANTTTILSPVTPGTKVSLQFSEFDLEEDFDFLTVYDGTGASATVLGDFTGSVLPPQLIATNPEGKLRLVFWTDPFIAHPGWRGTVSCVTPPATPFALTATVVGETQVHLMWTNNADDETGYVIERASGSRFEEIATVVANVKTFDDGNVLTGKIYTYRVRAVRGKVVSDYSPEARVTLGNAPLLMQNGTFTACNTRFMDAGGDDDFRSNVDYTLTLNPDIPGHKVSLQFSMLSLDNQDKLWIYDGSTTQAPLIGAYMSTVLPPGIIATNSSGSLTISLISDGTNPAPGWEALIECIATPAVPGNLQAQLDGGQVRLTWEDLSDDETGFAIDRATGSQFAKVDIVAAGTTSYTDATLPLDRTLTYRVRALRDDLTSGPSNTAAVMNGVPPIVMHNGTVTTCNGILRDPGVDEPYGNEAMAMTINPDTPGKRVVLTFSKIDVGYSTLLSVYNGRDIFFEDLLWDWSYWDKALPGPIQSVEPNGRLLIRFSPYIPDPRGTGWEARISCVDKGPLSILFDDRTVDYVDPEDDRIRLEASALAPRNTYSSSLTYSIADDPSSTGQATLSPNSFGGILVNVTKVGTIRVKASVAENAFFTATEKIMTLTINKGTRSIGFSTPPVTMTDAPFELRATIGPNQRPAPDDLHFEVLPPLNDIYTGDLELNGPLATPTHAGRVRITASLEENDLFLGSERISTMEIGKAAPSIAFDDFALDIDSPPVDLAARAYDGAEFFYSIDGANTGGVSLSGPRSQTVTPVLAGTVTLKAFLPESKYYAYAEKQATLTIGQGTGKRTQTIDFDALETVTADRQPFLLEAAATSGLPVTFRILSGPATVSGRQISLTGQTGTVQVEASQPGDADYYAAEPVVQSLVVERNNDGEGGGGAVTGIEDPITNRVYLSPNPASTAVLIKSTEVTMSKISVIDLLGRSTDHVVDHRYEHRLETGNLQQGVYVVGVGLDNGTTIFKRLVIR